MTPRTSKRCPECSAPAPRASKLCRGCGYTWKATVAEARAAGRELLTMAIDAGTDASHDRVARLAPLGIRPDDERSVRIALEEFGRLRGAVLRLLMRGGR